MKIKLLSIACLFAALAVPSVMAQSGGPNPLADLRGTWSGSWSPESSRTRDAVTIELRVDGDALTGKMLTPEATDFSELSFDASTGVIRAEAANQSDQYSIEAKVEGTRITGTLTQNDVRGKLSLTKWTYFPRGVQ